MATEQYNEHAMRQRVEQALTVVKMVLDSTRRPAFPNDVPHEYNDKYKLAEVVATTALSAQINALKAIGLTTEHVQLLRKWAVEDKEIVTLRYVLICLLIVTRWYHRLSHVIYMSHVIFI